MQNKECVEVWTRDPGSEESTILSGSVGQGGVNRTSDVRNVQSRLNRVTAQGGGPGSMLDADGLCGPLTRGAILRFQQHHPGLLHDGRIDPGKNTWKSLLALSGEIEMASGGTKADRPDAREIAAPHHHHAPTPPLDPTMPLICMALARFRISAAIRALDVATAELDGINLKSYLRPDPKEALYQTYKESETALLELPTVHRCFKIADEKMKYPNVSDVLHRLRRIYTSMGDVIAATMLTTPKAERTGTRRFVRVIRQRTLDREHHGLPTIADAELQGWWKKNANLAHIRVGSDHVDSSDLITSLIHEMSHFVSHPSTYIVSAHPKPSQYNGAFNDTHAKAVRNAFCYEWYAFLASFKSERSTPNEALTLT
ncbi:peptidoglycan-binding protein [Bradyrhizobium lablabi]|uniref:peptidoglycan-binding domain-containing protein n=1 Tax=Bradyrhizobium lablabi TaxID=722472 RepID=UPI001BABE9CF|nr:peptidoglycan-binding domain-containing protein [Bradyrhizobium lablabi]MBR0693300.1 peptidoglycan-binding protein [Bradyrhizobium lablabi]